MLPRILMYEEGIFKVTDEGMAIPEVRDIVEKYPSNYQPYLNYIGGMIYPDSPYIRIPPTEKMEVVLYDTQQVMGTFDYEDRLVERCMNKLRSLYTTEITRMADELENEFYRWRVWLRDTPLQGGSEGNLTDRRAILKEIDKYALNLAKVRKQADEEISMKMKGDQEMGEY